MSRTNRRHTRAIERHRRNKGPDLLSKIADKKLEDDADKVVTALFEAITKRHNATAAGLLIQLAETAEYEDPALYKRAISLAEKWAREPQVELLHTDPQLPAGPKPLQLTDGAAAEPHDREDILDAEFEDDTDSSPLAQPAQAMSQ